MAICIGRCLSKSGIIEQGLKFAFTPFFFREVLFFRDSVLGELPPVGGLVVGGAFRAVLLSPPSAWWRRSSFFELK